MPDLSPHSPENPDFARVLEVRTLPEGGEFDFDVAPDAGEAAALARLMAAQSVRRMRFRGRLTALPRGGWALEGGLRATVVQTCVVSLDPVTSRIDTPVRRRFLPGAAAGGSGIVVSLDEDDEIEPLGARIDLGLVATEALALALPAYPRKPGAEIAPGLADGGGAGGTKPFASLAALRDKLGNGT